jgi:hypothetical protein
LWVSRKTNGPDQCQPDHIDHQKPELNVCNIITSFQQLNGSSEVTIIEAFL